MPEATTQAPTNQTNARKTRNNIIPILITVAVVAVAVVACYLIYYGASMNYVWYVNNYSEKTSEFFSDTNFRVIKDESDVDSMLSPNGPNYVSSVEYELPSDNTAAIRNGVKDHDYLVVAFTHNTCAEHSAKSGQYYIKSIKNGTAIIAHNESATDSGFNYYEFYDIARRCENEEYYLIIESKKKGDFDQVQRVDGLDYDRDSVGGIPNPRLPEPNYLFEGYQFGVRYSREAYFGDRPLIITSLEDADKYLYHEEDAESYSKEEAALRTKFTEEMLDADFETKDYIFVSAQMDYCGGSITSVGITEFNQVGNAKLVIRGESSCGPCAMEYYFYLIQVDKNIIKTITTNYQLTNDDYCEPGVAYKPVIYLYPEQETNVSVKLGATDKLLVSYPTYIDGWRVKAQPNGDLVDLDTGRGLYSLYYEAENIVSGMRGEGFVFRGEDTVAFLEEKLAQLGLTDREAEEFIVYWLPKMQNNPYNYVYFETTDEVAANMPLEVTPTPKTVIRINMEWKALDAPIKVKKQVLPSTPNRDGFTLVEWGGTIL